MEFLSSCDADIEKAAAALASGSLVAFPTETVYGLGADAFNVSALARIFEAKGRPRFDPLIIHIARAGDVYRIADRSSLDGEAEEKLSLLSKELWPGPLTIVLPKREEVPALATAGLSTAAVRFPSHETAQKLIRLSTGAVAAPSANPFGYLSPTCAAHVKLQLGEKADFIIDGGKTQVGVESTVLDLAHNTPRILRPGGTSREAIEAVIGRVEIFQKNAPPAVDEAQLSPGQLKSHYAPKTRLKLYKNGGLEDIPHGADEGRLYFSAPRKAKTAFNERIKVLSETGNLNEAAANLFEMLHELDSLKLRLILAEEAPDFGLGPAINDRLSRAAI